MEIYLVRHGDAENELQDMSRPLSAQGIDDIERISAFLAELNLNVSKIYHSNKLRAVQTAKALDKHVKPLNGMEESNGLLPMDDPRIWGNHIENMADDENIVLVGHLPHLGELASILLFGGMCKETLVDLPTGGVICLEQHSMRTWTLKWFINPNIIKKS